MIWFGWVLWHINHCRLFNAKSSLYIYTKYIWFGLVGFYGISTIVGYLMPNPFYTYINIWFLNIFFDNIFNEPELILFCTVKWFPLLYLIQIILFTINHLFAHRIDLDLYPLFLKEWRRTPYRIGYESLINSRYRNYLYIHSFFFGDLQPRLIVCLNVYFAQSAGAV